MFCQKCGAKNQEDSKFCESCGRELFADRQDEVKGRSKKIAWKISPLLLVSLVCGLFFICVLATAGLYFLRSDETPEKVAEQFLMYLDEDDKRAGLSLCTDSLQSQIHTSDKNLNSWWDGLRGNGISDASRGAVKKGLVVFKSRQVTDSDAIVYVELNGAAYERLNENEIEKGRGFAAGLVMRDETKEDIFRMTKENGNWKIAEII